MQTSKSPFSFHDTDLITSNSRNRNTNNPFRIAIQRAKIPHSRKLRTAKTDISLQKQHKPTRMRKFSDTCLPVSDTETAPADTDCPFSNTVFTYPTCFQAFPNHRNSLSDIEKSIFICRKKHFPCPKMPNYNPKRSNPSSKIPLPIIENFKKIIHLRNNRTQNNVIRETKSKCSGSGTQ